MNIPLKSYWDLLSAHLQAQKARFVLLVVLLLSSIGLQVLIPQITRYFIDAATAEQAADRLGIAALAFIGLALLQQVTAVSARYVGEDVAWTATNELRADLAAHSLQLDMSFHNNSSPGELIERIDGDVSELSNFFSQLVVRVIGNIVLLAGIMIVLLIEDVRVGAAFTVFSVVTLLALNRVRGIAIPTDRAMREAHADLFGYLEERLAGTEDIRASGAVDYVINGLYRLHHRILILWRKSWMLHTTVRFVAHVLLSVGYAIAFFSGYTLFRNGAITIGTAYLIMHYTNTLARPIRELTQQVENLQNVGAAIERISELKIITRTIVDGHGARFSEGPLTLEFKNVSFTYTNDDHDRVLRNISFELQPARILGLLGRTGSGKTTLTRLIFRLYDPASGNIMLDGTDIKDANLKHLRDRVAMVTQDVQLFQASVRDNLTFFNPSISDDRIHAVIEKLGLSEWYAGLPDGLDTKLETGGRSLSAGEAQLLALTRVFLRNPGLVILDEASSRLDPATEIHIERAINKLLENRTAIIVAHRLGTVQRADQIMILDDGHTVEFGERAVLANDPTSQFFDLLQTGMGEVLA